MAIFHVEITQLRADVWLVALRGEHDLASAAELRERLREPVESDRDIIVDLSDATFVESGVISELVLARQRVERAPGHRLVLVVPPESAAAGVLTIIDPDRRLFPVFETRDAALEDLSPSPQG